MMAMRADLADWIALNMVRGVGPRLANQLLEKYGSPGGVFAASRDSLIADGMKPDTIEDLWSSDLLDKAGAEIERLDGMNARVIILEDEDYPPLLREIVDPPIAIYVRGNLSDALAIPGIAVVGSRRCSTYGVNAAKTLSKDLAENGITIISGMARGIDAAAHQGAIEANGKTIAVVGTGLERTYPREHKKLESEIIESGAIISEFPLGTPPLPQNFPYRNRILSGLSYGVLVIEAAEHSGSLITARLAYEQGRDVFAVPGSINSQTSFGPNYLIKDGAKLVQIWRDVVEELPLDIREKSLGIKRGKSSKADLQPMFEAVELSDNERKILDILSSDIPAHIDQLMISSSLKTPELMNALLELELKDKIKQLPGKSFIKLY